MYKDLIKGNETANTKDHKIILDNTYYPEGGAMPEDDIILELSYFNEYKMDYSLRDASVIMGIVSMILGFMIGAFTYLGCKIRRDVRMKFIGDEEDEEEEEDEQAALV